MDKKIKKAIKEVKEHSEAQKLKKQKDFVIDELGWNLYNIYKTGYDYTKNCKTWNDVIEKMYLDLKGWK